MGRPKKTLSPEQVRQIETLAAVLTLDQIADFLGMGERTIRRRMREDARVLAAYEKGKAAAIAGVASNLIQQAKAGNVTAAIFYLKTQAGWKETDRVEHAGAVRFTLDIPRPEPAPLTLLPDGDADDEG